MALLRVGIDAGAGGIQGPLFRDGTFEFVPIPEGAEVGEATYGNTRGRYRRPLVEYFPERRRAVASQMPMHTDPEPARAGVRVGRFSLPGAFRCSSRARARPSTSGCFYGVGAPAFVFLASPVCRAR